MSDLWLCSLCDRPGTPDTGGYCAICQERTHDDCDRFTFDDDGERVHVGCLPVPAEAPGGAPQPNSDKRTT